MAKRKHDASDLEGKTDDHENSSRCLDATELEGVVKTFNNFNAFGFIAADDAHGLKKDVWFSKAQYLGHGEKLERCVSSGEKVRVKFSLKHATDGRLQGQAVEPTSVDMEADTASDDEPGELKEGVVSRFEFRKDGASVNPGKSFGFIRCDSIGEDVYFTHRSLSVGADVRRFQRELESQSIIRAVFRLVRSVDGSPRAESVNFIWEQRKLARLPRQSFIGDWICPGCGDHQFNKNPKCRRCKTSKPPDAVEKSLRPGDWVCPGCSEINFSKNTRCRDCATPNPDPEGTAAAAKRYQQECMKPGDWICPGCDQMQFAKTRECVHCSTRNPDIEGSTAAMLEGKAKLFEGKMVQGDWLCAECGDHQYARNKQCRKCGALKPLARPGDWRCPSCNQHEFAKNLLCRACGEPNPDPDGCAAARKEYYRSQMKPGDWLCPSCDETQYAMTAECMECGTANPDPEGCKAAMKESKAKLFRETARPGDWLCSECGEHIFGRSTRCRRCDTPRPDTDVSEIQRHRSDPRCTWAEERWQDNDRNWQGSDRSWQGNCRSSQDDRDHGQDKNRRRRDDDSCPQANAWDRHALAPQTLPPPPPPPPPPRWCEHNTYGETAVGGGPVVRPSMAPHLYADSSQVGIRGRNSGSTMSSASGHKKKRSHSLSRPPEPF